MLRFMSLVAYVTLVACASTPGATSVRDPQSVKLFNDTVEQREQLRDQWAQVSSQDRQFCEMRAGDCEVSVTDQRSELISAHRIPQCRAKSNSEQEAQCIVDELVKLGNPDPGTQYYKADVWCLTKLQACVASHQQDVAEKARKDRIVQRRRSIESSPQGIAWHARVAAASEKIKYIRATLPPTADGECSQTSDNSTCDASIKQFDTDLLNEISKSDTDFDIKKAQKTYEQLTKKQAACYEPEFKCLSKAVAKYGETNESRRWLQRNFDLLDKRQRLIERAGDHAAEPCIESAITSHQADIVQSYRAYVREPVLYFRTQLHRSFFALHTSEIDCLGGNGPDPGTNG